MCCRRPRPRLRPRFCFLSPDSPISLFAAAPSFFPSFNVRVARRRRLPPPPPDLPAASCPVSSPQLLLPLSARLFAARRLCSTHTLDAPFCPESASAVAKSQRRSIIGHFVCAISSANLRSRPQPAVPVNEAAAASLLPLPGVSRLEGAKTKPAAASLVCHPAAPSYPHHHHHPPSSTLVVVIIVTTIDTHSCGLAPFDDSRC